MNIVVRTLVSAAYHLFYNFRIEGKENIPQGGGLIIASNHRSFADPVIITIPLKRPVTYMAKDSLFKNKLLAAFIRGLGAFPVKRDAASTELFRTTDAILSAKKNLVIFPEGTRQYKNKVGAGKSGIAMVAARSGADVIPCGIVFEGEKLRFRSKLTLRFGKVIRASELAVEGTSTKELRRVRDLIMNGIKELVERDVERDEDTANANVNANEDSEGIVAVKMPLPETPETVSETLPEQEKRHEL
jgi:1-acyl-sn-glycerol-3-phosphate acyltransferase